MSALSARGAVVMPIEMNPSASWQCFFRLERNANVVIVEWLRHQQVNGGLNIAVQSDVIPERLNQS